MLRHEGRTANGRRVETRNCHFSWCGTAASAIFDGGASLCSGISILGSGRVSGRRRVTGSGCSGPAPPNSTCSGEVLDMLAVQEPGRVCRRPTAISASMTLSAATCRFISSTPRSVCCASGCTGRALSFASQKTLAEKIDSLGGL